MADDQETMRKNLAAALQDVQDMKDLVPFMDNLLTVQDIKNQLLEKIKMDNDNNNDPSIRKLYFEIEPNYLFRSLPPQIITHKIFEYLLFDSMSEVKKISLVNKFFNKMVSQYQRIFAANKYKVELLIPDLNKTAPSTPTMIHINHKSKTIYIANPIKTDTKVAINPTSSYSLSDPRQTPSDGDFMCRAINDYYASVTDELDLKEGDKYIIKKTSPSGWWFAENNDGEEGIKMIMYFVSDFKFACCFTCFWWFMTLCRLGTVKLFRVDSMGIFEL